MQKGAENIEHIRTEIMNKLAAYFKTDPVVKAIWIGGSIGGAGTGVIRP